jgi:hypothetical protein
MDEFKPLPPPDYTPSEALKRIAGMNKAMIESIEKIGFEKTGVAFLLAFYEANGYEE